MASFPKELIQSAQASTDQLAQEVERLKSEVKLNDDTRKLLAGLSLYASRGWALHILDLKAKHKGLLKQLKYLEHSSLSTIEEIMAVASEAAKTLEPMSVRIPKALDEACTSAGLPLDTSSRHPEYTFDQRFITLTFDEFKKIAAISNYEMSKPITISADIDAVVEKIKEERSRLFDRPFDGPKFLRNLRSTYKSLIAKEKKKDGESIQIREISRQIGNSKHKYRSDEFLVDLSRLLKDGSASIDGRHIELQQTKDELQGMLLLGKENRGYVGYLLFKKDT